MDATLASLNAAQREAVLSEAQVLQVLAPPGSGKTKTLTARVAHHIASGLQPWSIIVCTFTVKAAREMKHRVQELVDESNSIKIGTFHGIALRYLRRYRQLIGLSNSFGVADTSDSTAILRRIIKLQAAGIEATAARSRISSLKAKGINCHTFAQSEGRRVTQTAFAKVYQEYEAELKRGGYLDYDDILLRCVDLLKAHPDCVKDIRAVFVDEFQDTNSVQYELMALFAQKHHKITIVGDPDQSIYGWRSAEIKNLHLMRQQWSDTVTINLEENYRSSGSILVAAQAVIEQDRGRPPKTLQATLSYGHKPVLRRLPSAKDEATWLVGEIIRIQGLTGGLLNHSDFAILLRTANLSRVIEAAFGTSGIPYRMVGGTKFFDRVEVKIVLDYLRVVEEPAHNEALARVLNVPPRRIGDKTLEKLQTEAQQKSVSVWSLVQAIARGHPTTSMAAYVSTPACKGLEQFTNVILTCRKRLADKNASIVDLINIIVQKTGLQAHLKSKYAEDYESRWGGIEDLIAQASEPQPSHQEPVTDSDELLELPDDTTASALSDFLANAALAASIDAEKDGPAKPMVTISTMHAAKGLEWPVVFLPACYNGSIPHSRAEDTDEERRLLYVAMTRAQAMLYLSCAKTDGQRQATTLSMFVEQPSHDKLFDEIGPPIRVNDAQSLATVLRRAEPGEVEIQQTSAELVRDFDDYWPGDGSDPVPMSQCHWPIASIGKIPGSVAPVLSGFASVRSQLGSLQQQELATQKSQARSVASSKASKHPGLQHNREPRQRSSFFTSRSTTIEDSSIMQHSQRDTTRGSTKPLLDITSKVHHNITTVPHTHKGLPECTVSSEPLHKRQRTIKAGSKHLSSYNPYVMFSSSPIQASKDEEVSPSGILPSSHTTTTTMGYKTASTTHLTSYQLASISRKTLGVKRSMNGWAQRAKK